MLRHFGLEQAQLAELMGVKLDRVKSLVLGRAKNLRLEELARLVEKLRLRQAWLVHGELPQLEPELELPRAERSVAVPPSYSVGSAEIDAAMLAREMAHRPLRAAEPSVVSDERLLQDVVAATAAELDARGIRLSDEQRLRLYWGVFQLSLAQREVNRMAIQAMLPLAMLPQTPGG